MIHLSKDSLWKALAYNVNSDFKFSAKKSEISCLTLRKIDQSEQITIFCMIQFWTLITSQLIMLKHWNIPQLKFNVLFLHLFRQMLYCNIANRKIDAFFTRSNAYILAAPECISALKCYNFTSCVFIWCKYLYQYLI